MASKVFREVLHMLSPCSRLNETSAGRFVDVYIFECFAIKNMLLTSSSTRLVDSINMAFIIYTTYHIGVTNFGDYRSELFIPW